MKPRVKPKQSKKQKKPTVNTALKGLQAMSLLRWIYLALAVWGAIHPMYYFIAWFQAEGWSIMKMVDAWHSNTASSGLVWDLTIAAIALTIWILAEVFTRRNWSALIAIPATFGIGVSCGLPLYLFLRTRPIN